MKRTLYLLPFLIILTISGCVSNHYKVNVESMNPRIVTLKPTDVIGIKQEGKICDLSFPKVWEDFFTIYDKTSHKDNNIFYGITYTNNTTRANEGTMYTYMVGTKAGIYNSLPLEMQLHTIPGGEYAVFNHVGPISYLQKTFNYILNDWMPKSGYKRRSGDVFEYYDHRFKDERYDSVIEVWIPVAKR